MTKINAEILLIFFLAFNKQEILGLFDFGFLKIFSIHWLLWLQKQLGQIPSIGMRGSHPKKQECQENSLSVLW